MVMMNKINFWINHLFGEIHKVNEYPFINKVWPSSPQVNFKTRYGIISLTPSNPAQGQIWFDSTTHQVHINTSSDPNNPVWTAI